MKHNFKLIVNSSLALVLVGNLALPVSVLAETVPPTRPVKADICNRITASSTEFDRRLAEREAKLAEKRTERDAKLAENRTARTERREEKREERSENRD